MKRFNKSTIISLGLLSLVMNIHAATQSDNYNFWLHYFGKLHFHRKWSLSFETSVRYTDWGKQYQQWLARPSVDYTINKHFTGSIGYSHYKTFTYGSPAMFKSPIEEAHIWEQISSKHSLNQWTLNNRLRDENRFIGADKTYRKRLRYMMLWSYPVINKKLNLLLGNEVFLNIGNYSGKSLMNQNRVIVGFSWLYNPTFQIQLSYIHQNIWNYNNSIFENNPTLRLSILNAFNPGKQKK